MVHESMGRDSINTTKSDGKQRKGDTRLCGTSSRVPLRPVLDDPRVFPYFAQWQTLFRIVLEELTRSGKSA